MGFIAAEGISFCVAGGQAIFLDLPGDRYMSLAADADQSFRRLLSGEKLSRADEQDIDNLVRSGLLIRTADHRLPKACKASTPRTSVAYAKPTMNAGMLTLALLNIARAGINVRLRQLRATLGSVRERKLNADFEEAPSADRLQEIAAVFKCCSLIKSPLDRCLSRSIAVAHMMIDCSIRPDVVLGVRMQPFSAHCWVEHVGILVNDELDRVRNYTPILVI